MTLMLCYGNIFYTIRYYKMLDFYEKVCEVLFQLFLFNLYAMLYFLYSIIMFYFKTFL